MRSVLVLCTFSAAFVLGGLYSAWALVCRGDECPSIDVLEDYTPRQTSKLYAADGRFIAEIGLERRTLVPLRDIPTVVRQAFQITEDKRFYEHAGVDWYRVFGAGLRNLRAGGYAQGFSTITMQLARNVFPERISREKTLVRKLKEAKVARAIEAKYSKDKILELYLNQIYLGNGAYGVETAAQRYFGKSVRDLNLAEASTLAALPKGPERYNPRKYPDRAITRRNTIVELLRRERAISDEDARLAKAFPLKLGGKTESGEVAPYFVEWVRRQLDAQFGQQLYEQGLKVYTTLDIEMQSAAERALESQLRKIEAGEYGKYSHMSYEQYVARAASGEQGNAPNSPYLQGSFVAMDPRTGAVRALVGGRDYDDSKFNRATQALRQPGSTFKPIVYSTAIQNGRPASYILDDSPIVRDLGNGQTWTPQNYDLKFEGPVPLRRALMLSRNIPTINLGIELGEQSVIEMGHRFGLSTDIPPYPSIHIGSADVYPIEMIAAYSAFATLGTRAAPIGIVRVENAKGDVLWEPQSVRSQVLSPEEAWLMVDMLKDVVQHGTAYSSVWGAGFHIPSGGKTGTTNDGTDVWYIGFTADLVAGLWMGLDRPQKIKSNAQGGVLAAPAYTTFMKEVYSRKPAPPDWPRPEGILAREIDRTTAKLKNPFCPANVVATEYYIPGTEPIEECPVHSPFTSITDSTAAQASPLDTSHGVRVTPGGVGTIQPSRPTTPAPKNPRDTNPFSAPVVRPKR